MAEHVDASSGQVSPPVDETKTVAAVPASPGISVAGDCGDPTARPDTAGRGRARFGSPSVGLAVGLATVVALAGLSGWLGYRAHQSEQTDQRDRMFLQVARQAAVDFTSIDWTHPDGDVQRILDLSTGAFRDDFSARSAPFIDTVKKLQSKSVGTVVDAGLESTSGDEAQVLVAMSVKTSLANSPEQQPRSWRMRISVQKLDGDVTKVSNVVFVP